MYQNYFFVLKNIIIIYYNIFLILNHNENYWLKKIDKLSTLWSRGIPARENAEKLGNASRNAVQGKQIDSAIKET